MSDNWHIAQLNVGTAKYELDDARMDGFMSQLDAINALAEQSPGFVWRLQSDSGNATDIDVGGDPRFIVNLSVWESTDALFDFVYKTAHTDVMSGRRNWFEKPQNFYQVLWWTQAGNEPSPEEALERLARLNAKGPTVDAFDFKHRYPPPDSE